MASQTVLLTLSGIDRPGVTSTLFAALSKHPVIVLDIKQLVVCGRLVLSVLLALEPDAVNTDGVIYKLRQDIRSTAAALDMEVSTVPGAMEDNERRRGRVHVTVLGAPLRAGAVSQIALEIACRGGNIDRILLPRIQ